MHQQGGAIREALESIASRGYVLPAIQREFVWRPEQVCNLFDSVMQGYPFGEFMFWRVEAQNASQYRWYDFVRDYHQRDNPHCPELGPIYDKPLTAVLDGQQRLTAFNIGLRGSMAIKLPYKWWNSSDAFPKRVLALDLLAPPDPDEEGSRYVFEFVNEDRIGLWDTHLWFRVSDIMSFPTENPAPDMLDWISDIGLDGERQRLAFRTLNRLHQAICVEPVVAYYEEKSQDVERVLNIFIRCNSGGTPLSYSNLLLSIAVSQWDTLDARSEVHGLVDEMNKVRAGLLFNADFVLKAGLMLDRGKVLTQAMLMLAGGGECDAAVAGPGDGGGPGRAAPRWTTPLASDLRPGNAAANSIDDHIALLDAAIGRLPEAVAAGHKVENFTHENMAILEMNWPNIHAPPHQPQTRNNTPPDPNTPPKHPTSTQHPAQRPQQEPNNSHEQSGLMLRHR